MFVGNEYFYFAAYVRDLRGKLVICCEYDPSMPPDKIWDLDYLLMADDDAEERITVISSGRYYPGLGIYFDSNANRFNAAQLVASVESWMWGRQHLDAVSNNDTYVKANFRLEDINRDGEVLIRDYLTGQAFKPRNPEEEPK